jgi:hypothetical protein
METQVSIPLPTRLFLDLAELLKAKGDTRDPVLAVADAVDYWMQNVDWKPELLRQAPTSHLGYQWKSFFLPDGTEVRMQYKSEWYYAKVEGDKLVYEGEPITPGRLANTIAGSSRNAWKDLWIKRPADTEWLLADDCRAAGEQG